MSVANDASESPETRESISPTEPATQQQLEYDALVAIVGQQAEAINAMIVSLNNLQARVAHLESPVEKTNGNKRGLISLS